MKKNILAIIPSFIPSINIGIINPMLFLQKKGKINFKVTLPSLFKLSLLENVDCIVFCRNSFPNDEWILNEVIQREIPYIYEIDDNFFEIPYNIEIGRIHRNPVNLSSFINFISYASLVRTYSDLLAQDAGFYNKKIEINRVYFDTNLTSGLNREKSNKLKIVYATSRMADEQQDIFTEALKNIAKNYLQKVEIYFWGPPIVDEELKQLNNVFHLAPIYNYEKFIKKFYEMGFDIGLAPIFEGRFFNSKTNNKYREYSACKIAGIYSNQDLYKNCINHEENGLLVENNPISWYQAIEKLIIDDTLRNKIIEESYTDIEVNYSFEHYCNIWMQSIEKALTNISQKRNLDSFLQCNSYINCIIVEDYNLKNEGLTKIKQNLFNSTYIGTFIRIISNNIISSEDLYQANEPLKESQNIILLSDDISWIKYFNNVEKSKNNFILLTSLDKSICNKLNNIHFISIDGYSLGIFDNHQNNVFIEINRLIKKVFTQTQNQPFISRLKNFLKAKIRNNWFRRKITYLINKKNNFKSKLYTSRLINKINNDSKK
jgi:glycosyltransferase involved in cell wall biosynthesis